MAAELFALRNEYADRVSISRSAERCIKAYEESLYRFDQLYRHFCENADVAESRGWDMLEAACARMSRRATATGT